jgi:hypothetical protein
MGTYSTHNRLGGGQQNLSTAFKTIVALTAATATLRRAAITMISVGADGPPNATDCQIVYDISRQTAAGTSTTVTPVSLDIENAASDTVGTVNYTAEGTITGASSVLALAMNQRASQIWYAPPGGELVIPRVNLAGFAFRALSPTYAAPVLIDVHHIDI